MSRPQAPEPALDVQGDSPVGTGDEDGTDGTQHSHRMLSFSDALLSIIATVMILPVTHTELSPQQQFDKSVQKLLATRIAVYLMTFLIVTVAWAAHTRLFQVVGKIDDTLALLNLACMMTITFLPFTALIVVYAFRFPHLLNPQIGRSAHRRLHRQRILQIVLRGPALCFLAAIFSLLFYPVSYLLLVMVIVLPYVSKATTWCRDKLMGPPDPPAHSMEFFTFDLQEPLSKERVEAFSDGVYAIVATLLILDICSDNVPDAKDVAERFHGSLVAALSEFGPQFLAYFGSFATVGLLWFAHHSLFLHVRKATQSMGLLNTLSLAFVGGLPLAYQQTSAFARQPHDELERVRVSCAIVFFASIFQFAMWTTALLHEAETLQPSARFGGREHAFMFAKLALYPCASLLAFASTCFLSRFSTAIFHLMQIAVPFAFLLLRLLVRLGLALLKALRGLAPPAQPADEGPQAPLLPAPC
ncbi:endosomal/lysosomal proton channel TMEM175 isoform X13 [Desmodus rotundus]|uniref:endosomal/lysosomal proton channel TMEM175 isoform X13 n=1 Tax=Desmodus rotundus TaxID=9430 RepID=UPI002380DA5F|nr:endosomal/lysosomal proton channel TMEM175 isoform X13 [Desmodus rotundus]